MGRIFLISILLLISNLSIGQTKSFLDKPYLETTASADTLVQPDVIYLAILIREKDERNKTSVEAMEAKMIEKLMSLGIDLKEQLTLSDLASNFKKYFLKQQDILKDKAYSLKVNDSQTAGRVLVELEQVGISNVSLDKTEYLKMDDLKLQLKSMAVEKAKLQAEFLVKPLGQKVGKAILITDTYYGHFDGFSGSLNEVVVVGYSDKAKQEYEPPAIEFKPIRVQSEVSIKFEIE